MFPGMSQPSEHSRIPRGIILGSTEHIVRHLRTHPKVLFMPGMAVLACLAAAVATGIWVPQDFEGLPVQLIALGAIALAFLCLSFAPWVKWFTNTFTLTNQNLIHSEGLIWKRTHTTRLDRVSDVRCDRGLLDRIFGCGTLIITNAGSGGADPFSGVMQSGGPQMKFHDIPRVEDVTRELKDLTYTPR